MSFQSLHAHSEYSLLDGACKVEKIAEVVKSLGQTAVALTDHGVMFGAVAFYKACKAAGVKPIIGCEVYVAPRGMRDKEHGIDNKYSHLILLVKNEEGYHNLCKLVSAAWVDGFYIKPRIDWDLLHKYAGGLICLSGCLAGEIPQKIIKGEYEQAKAKALELQELFGAGGFYLEIQNHGIPDEARVVEGLVRMHNETGIPLVATNDAHYLTKDDWYAQDVLLCIQTGKNYSDPDRMRFETREFYLKSEEEMQKLFPGLQEALDNTSVIADACNFDFEFGHYHIPAFELPEGEASSYEYMRKLCERGFAERYGSDREDVHKQLEYELGVIREMGFVEYFLIVADYINYAKSNGIPVGPGRGSAAGSVVAYCMHITDIDPIKYSLFFERFLNPERVTMPDIDVDFCVRRRGEVIDYVNRKYGNDHVAQIVTFGTMAARMAVRDAARVLGVSYADADAVAKQIPQTLHMTIDGALEASKPLKDMYDSSSEIKNLIDVAKALEGMPRHSSKHAAGVVITDKPVQEYVPLSTSEESVVCQYQMTTLEELGLLKMDFLGLRNLTVLEDAAEMVRKHDLSFRIDNIPDHDDETFAMLSAGKTGGVFQLESPGITSVCTQIKPKSIEDITAVIALYRPGPMESIPRFIECTQDPSKITYKHPLLEPILNVTYGCMVYQEQVQQVFRDLAGYSLGQADVIRRAMSKKKQKVIDAERQSFVYGDPKRNIKGAVANGVPADVANSIYDEILAFASYAFNKAHAVSYAVVTFRTAYMKCHYPKEYMAALLTSELNNTLKVSEYIGECRDMGIQILPPDINESETDFSVVGDHIRFGLAAIKGAGRGVVRQIVAEREQNGSYISFQNFCTRVVETDTNKKVVESLIKAGAFDSLGYTRKSLLRVYTTIMTSVASDSKRKMDGQFGLFDDINNTDNEISIPDVGEFNDHDKMRLEKEAAGLFLTGHPLDSYREDLQQSNVFCVGDILRDFSNSETEIHQFHDNDPILVAGVIESIKTKTTKKNTLMSYVTLEDNAATMDIIAFQRTLDSDGMYLKENEVVVVYGKVSVRDENDVQIIANIIRPIARLNEMSAEIEKVSEYAAVPSREKEINIAFYLSEAPRSCAPNPVPKSGRTLWVKIPSEADLDKLWRISTHFPGGERMAVWCEKENSRRAIAVKICPELIRVISAVFGTDSRTPCYKIRFS